MKLFLSQLLRFIFRFGVLKGSALSFRLKLGNLNNIKVPDFKYPVSLRKGTTDYHAFYQILLHDQYNFKFPIVPVTIIDGGANIGLASLIFKNRYPESIIVAVEPDYGNFAQLVNNIKSYKNIHPVRAGLWPKKAFLNITNKYGYGDWGMVTEEVSEETEGTIDTITIPEIMEQFHFSTIDLLKLDIETAEKELFENNYEIWLPKVKIIVIELHDLFCKGTGRSFFNAITKTFPDFSFYQFGENSIIVNEVLCQGANSN
jgi:FkbM family methyltransferase